MGREVLVYLDLEGDPYFVGHLWTHRSGGHESATFEYDRTWLQHPHAFSLEPALKLGAGKFQTRPDQRLFGAIGDSAPDRWGLTLMRRAEQRRARNANETPRTLREVDYLLMVNDEARIGALRFKENPDGHFLQHGPESIPPLVELGRLLSAADKVSVNADAAEDLRLLLAPGSSLGGARPKASVRDKEGALMIAKFPSKEDEIDTVAWEALALTLARRARIQVPDWRLEMVGKRRVLILRRFDRDNTRRICFLSATSMLGALDNETHSYMEIVDVLRQYGASRRADSHQLWRRMLFNGLITNTDDHLRNHGFIYVGPSGWRLAPAYDLNPVPTDIRPRVLTTTINEADGTCSLELILSVAEYFEVSAREAHRVIKEVAEVVKGWRRETAALRITKGEIERMSSAFEHDTLQDALALSASRQLSR